MSEQEPRSGRDRERSEDFFDLLRSMVRVPCLSAFLPKETRQHLRAARREQLLAVRSLLDKTIERLEEKEKPSRTAERIKIE